MFGSYLEFVGEIEEDPIGRENCSPLRDWSFSCGKMKAGSWRSEGKLRFAEFWYSIGFIEFV